MSASNVSAQRAAWFRALSGHHLPGLQSRVAICIATYVNTSSGLAWPSQETIAQVTRIAPKNVSAAIKKLVEKGWLLKDQRPGGGLQYRLQVPAEALQLEGENHLQPEAGLGDAGIQLDRSDPSSQMGNPPPVAGVSIEDTGLIEGGASSATLSPTAGVDRSGNEPIDRAGRPKAASPFLTFCEIYPPSHLEHCRVAFEDALDVLGLDAIIKAARKYADAVSNGLAEPISAAAWLRLGVERRSTETNTGDRTNVA